MGDNIPDNKIGISTIPNSMVKTPISPNNAFMYQIFFLTQNYSQDVEVVETEEIDFGEITQRLKLGESVFIKYKDLEMLEPKLILDKQRT